MVRHINYKMLYGNLFIPYLNGVLTLVHFTSRTASSQGDASTERDEQRRKTATAASSENLWHDVTLTRLGKCASLLTQQGLVLRHKQ